MPPASPLQRRAGPARPDCLTRTAGGQTGAGSSTRTPTRPLTGSPARKPLTEDALAQRLHALGISPRQSRNTALFTLAADVPAAILAKTLGIHIKAAIQWQKISGGDWAAYDQLEPSPDIGDLLRAIDRDPTAIFWGWPGPVPLLTRLLPRRPVASAYHS